MDPDITFNDATNTFVVNGTINNTAVDDTTLTATPLGLDSSNNIVKLTTNNINNVAFGNVQVAGGALIAADSNTDTVTFSAGDGIALNGNATTDTITISAAETTGYGVDDSTLFSEIIINKAPTNNTNKYFFFDPNGLDRNIFLSASGVTEEQSI